MSSRQTGGDATIAAGIGAVAFTAYLPALAMGFTADDFFILARLKELGGLDRPLAYFGALGFFEYYRPLAFLSHALDWEIWRTHPAGFHLTNICLHALNAVLVFVLGRRLVGRTPAIVAGLLFALHPVSHEAVYWISARFDLLATCLALLTLLVVAGSPHGPLIGALAFGLALLAKESALAVPVIVVAYDVIVRRLDWRRAAWRLGPFILAVGVYAWLRAQSGALDPAGGAARIPKLLMLATMTAALLWAARARLFDAEARPVGAAGTRSRSDVGVALLLVGGAVLAALFAAPAASAWLREKIGFASFSLFYLVSPISVPAPPPSLFDRPPVLYAAIELVGVLVVAFAGWFGRRWIVRHPPVVFLLVFVAAALAPVSSMTSGPRYLYLASGGLCLLAAIAFDALPASMRKRGLIALALVLVAFVAQLAVAGRSWKWASDMTREALATIGSQNVPCGTQDIVLLTTPVAIRGVFSNLNEIAFDVAGCRPASFRTVLRVVRTDAHVDVTRRGEVIELRMPRYENNVVASRDLRHFDLPVVSGDPLTIDTPVGRLESTAENGGRLFRLRLAEPFVRARFFFYSDGAVHALAQ